MTCLNRDPPKLRRDVMLSQTNARRPAITNLGQISAHIRRLRIILQMRCSTFTLSRLQAEDSISRKRSHRYRAKCIERRSVGEELPTIRPPFSIRR
jgi:hypothetical protein